MKISIEQQLCLFSSPLFAPLRLSLDYFAPMTELPCLDKLNKELVIDSIKFVQQSFKNSSFEEHYEPRIFLRGEVQTREHCWHDFFNALVWHKFTKTKRAINKLHYELQKQSFPAKNRTPAQDTLTIFDEHGVIALSKNKLLLDLITNRQWYELFVERKEQAQAELSLIIFGHGLYEKALKPYVGLCAHSLLIQAEPSNIDELCAEIFVNKGSRLRTSDLNPIPILGYPGWWTSQDKDFFANSQYFRS